MKAANDTNVNIPDTKRESNSLASCFEQFFHLKFIHWQISNIFFGNFTTLDERRFIYVHNN